MQVRCSFHARLSIFVYIFISLTSIFIFLLRLYLSLRLVSSLSLRPFVSVESRRLIINSSSYHDPITRKIFCRQYFKPSHQRLVHLKVSQSQVSAIPGRILNHPIKSEPSKDGLIFSSFTEAAHLLSP